MKYLKNEGLMEIEIEQKLMKWKSTFDGSGNESSEGSLFSCFAFSFVFGLQSDHYMDNIMI